MDKDENDSVEIYNNESFWWRPDGFDVDRNYSEERG